MFPKTLNSLIGNGNGESLILPLANDLAIVKGVGPVSFSRYSNQIITDHEGILRTVVGGVSPVNFTSAGFEGSRIVTNLLTNSESLSNWWVVGGATSSTNTVTFTANTNDAIGITTGIYKPVGTTHAVNIKMSGSGSVNLVILRNGDGFLIMKSVKLTAIPTWYSVVATDFTAGNINGIVLQNSVDGTVKTITVYAYQFEDITGQSIQFSGEYVKTTNTLVSKCFDYTYQNTPTNLLLYSDNLLASGWQHSSSSTVSNVTDSLGGTTCIALKEDATNNIHSKYHTFAVSKEYISKMYTSSLDIKQNTGTRNIVLFTYGASSANGCYCIINPSTGAVVVPSTAIGTGFKIGQVTVETKGNGYFRVKHLCTSDGSAAINVSVELAIGSTRGSYAGDNSSQVSVGWIQLEDVSNFPPYMQMTGTYVSTTHYQINKYFDYTLVNAPEIVTDQFVNYPTTFWQVTDASMVVEYGRLTLTHVPISGHAAYAPVNNLEIGEVYRVTYTIETIVSGSVRVGLGSTAYGPTHTTAGTFTEDIVCSGVDSYIRIQTQSSDTIGIVSGLSIKKLACGNPPIVPLRPSILKNGYKKYLVFEEAPRSKSFVTGDRIEAINSNGLRSYYTCTVGGTTSASAVTWPASGIVVDGTVTWQYSGPCTLTGLVFEPASTNKCTNYNVIPADSVGANIATVWNANGSNVSISGNVITLSGAGATTEEPAFTVQPTAGKIYECTVTVTGLNVGGSVSLYQGSGNAVRANNTLTSNGTFTERLTNLVTGPAPYIIVCTTAIGTTGVITIECKEVAWAVGTKSYGAKNSSAELILNGDFASDTSWSKSSGEVTISAGKLRFNTTAATWAFPTSNVLTAGKLYEVAYTIDSISAQHVYAQCGNARGANRTAAGTYTETILADGAPFYLVTALGFSVVAVIDNVSVKEVSITYVQNITGLTLTGGTYNGAATYPTLEIIDDSVKHKEVGIYNITGGKAYKLTNPSGGVAVTAVGSSATSGTPTAISAWVYGSSGFMQVYSSTLIPTAFLSRGSWSGSPSGSDNLLIGATNGGYIVFILNQHEDQLAPTSPIIVQGATSTRPSSSITIPALGNLSTNGFDIECDIIPKSVALGTVIETASQKADFSSSALRWSNLASAVSSATKTVGKWLRFSGRKSSVGGDLFTDGIKVANATPVGAVSVTSNIAIGSTIAGDSQLVGTIMNLRIKKSHITDVELVATTSPEK